MGAGCWHTCVIKQGMYVIASNHWWPEWSCPPTKVTKPWQLHTIQERQATRPTKHWHRHLPHQMTQVSFVTLHSPANENRSTVSTWILAVCPSTSITVLTSSQTSAISLSLPKDPQHWSATFLARRPSWEKMFAGHNINNTHINYNTVSSVPTLGRWNVNVINLSKYELIVQLL